MWLDGRGKSWRLHAFSGWHDPIPKLVDATPCEAIIRTACTSGPARAHERGRIALEGDAGHLMLVNLGRSACQAVEDAVVLADELATSHDVVSALSRYNARRVPHTAAVVGHVPQPAPSTQAT